MKLKAGPPAPPKDRGYGGFRPLICVLRDGEGVKRERKGNLRSEMADLRQGENLTREV